MDSRACLQFYSENVDILRSILGPRVKLFVVIKSRPNVAWFSDTHAVNIVYSVNASRYGSSLVWFYHVQCEFTTAILLYLKQLPHDRSPNSYACERGVLALNFPFGILPRHPVHF